MAFHLGAAAFWLGQETEQIPGGGEEVGGGPIEMQLLSPTQQRLLAPGRTGQWPEAGSHLRWGRQEGPGQAAWHRHQAPLWKTGGSLCLLSRAQSAGLQI